MSSCSISPARTAGSPIARCRLCSRARGARLRIEPVLLGGIFKATNNQSPMAAFAAVKGKLAYEKLEMRRFIARHGLDAVPHEPAFPGQHADADARLRRRARRGAGRGLSRGGAAGTVGGGARPRRSRRARRRGSIAPGLDGAALLERAQTPEIKAALAEATSRAVARGVFGLPTFFVGEEMFFGKERLGQVEEELPRIVTDCVRAAIRSRGLGGAGDAGRHGAGARRRQSGVPRAGEPARRAGPRGRRRGGSASASRWCCGLALLGLLAGLVSLISPLFALFGHGFSLRDLVLLGGGFFLLAKATQEIHDHVEGQLTTRSGPRRDSALLRRSRRSSRSTSCSRSTASSRRSA